MGFLKNIFGGGEPEYRYITSEPMRDDTGRVPAKSVLDFFSLPFANSPEVEGFKCYLEKSARNWTMKRYHAYLNPLQLGLFSEADLIWENDRRLLMLFHKDTETVDRPRLLAWVMELHAVFGPDLFEKEGEVEEDVVLKDAERWAEEPFWEGRRWPAFENSPEFELKMDEMQGLTCTVWL